MVLTGKNRQDISCKIEPLRNFDSIVAKRVVEEARYRDFCLRTQHEDNGEFNLQRTILTRQCPASPGSLE